jgi:hypothetical protein
LGYAGVLGEWELTATVRETAPGHICAIGYQTTANARTLPKIDRGLLKCRAFVLESEQRTTRGATSMHS